LTASPIYRALLRSAGIHPRAGPPWQGCTIPNALEFSVLPVVILGQVYERFLGKAIRLTAGHRAKVEEKPEYLATLPVTTQPLPRGAFQRPADTMKPVTRAARRVSKTG